MTLNIIDCYYVSHQKEWGMLVLSCSNQLNSPDFYLNLSSTPQILGVLWLHVSCQVLLFDVSLEIINLRKYIGISVSPLSSQ